MSHQHRIPFDERCEPVTEVAQLRAERRMLCSLIEDLRVENARLTRQRDEARRHATHLQNVESRRRWPWRRKSPRKETR